MPQPARALPTQEDEADAVPGPLRDWLAAIRRYESEETVRPVPAADNTAWEPRVVQKKEAVPQPIEEADISELMAENLMLKAKLKVEHDRQDALQSALAEQIRELREHIAGEMDTLEELRAEQEEAKAQFNRFQIERETLRRDLDQATAERESLRQDRDLWRARAEALAQPLFQSAKA